MRSSRPFKGFHNCIWWLTIYRPYSFLEGGQIPSYLFGAVLRLCRASLVEQVNEGEIPARTRITVLVVGYVAKRSIGTWIRIGTWARMTVMHDVLLQSFSRSRSSWLPLRAERTGIRIFGKNVRWGKPAHTTTKQWRRSWNEIWTVFCTLWKARNQRASLNQDVD